MNKFALLAVLAMSAPFISVSAHAVDKSTQVNACVTQMTDKNITDKASAKKVCGCVVNEQSKITQAQKTEIDNWVKDGKDVRQNSTYQTLVNKLKACGNGIKFNQPKN